MEFSEFRGKRILITGGSSGIGKALALKVAHAGATVGVISHDSAEFASMPEGIRCYRADVTHEEEVRTAVDLFAQETQRIDMLVNSAGVSLWKGLFEMDAAFWDNIFAVNVKGTFLVTQAVARHMVRQKAGIIVNIASMSGLKSGMPRAAAYMSSKWAIIGFSRNIQLELKEHGIKVGCLCPGSTRTVLHEKANTPNQELMLETDDIASTIMFMLAAPKNGHVQLLAEPAFFENWM